MNWYSTANHVPMFLVGDVVGDYFHPTNPLQEFAEGPSEADQDKADFAREVTTHFMDPMIQGEYHRIDETNMFDNLIMNMSRYSDDDGIILAMHAMSAAIGARSVRNSLRTCNANLSTCDRSKNELIQRVSELEREVKILRGETQDMKSVGTSIEAKLEAQSVEVLPMIAQVNITMGWYYYMYGFDTSKAIEPDKYITARNRVIVLGDRPDPTTGRVPAYDELMRSLIADRRALARP